MVWSSPIFTEDAEEPRSALDSTTKKKEEKVGREVEDEKESRGNERDEL